MRYGVAALVVFLLAFPASAATLTWTGNVSSLWSDAGNWSPGAVPSTGDTLVFPASATTFDTTAFAVTLSSMSFATAYTVSSSGVIGVSGGIAITGGSETVAIDAPVRLVGTNSWTLGTNALTIQSLDTNGQTLNAQSIGGVLDLSDISGTGSLNAHGGTLRLTTGSFSGTVNTDTLAIEQAQLSSATVVAQNVTGNGVVKSLSVTGNLTPTVPAESATGTLTASTSLSLTNTTFHLTVDTITPTVSAPGSSSLSNVTLSLTSGPAGPSDGQSITIIDRGAGGSGTFNGLPEGSHVTLGIASYTLTYAGGPDGHDIVLLWTGSGGARTWTGAASSLWSNPSNWSPSGVPTAGADLVFPQGAPLSSTNDLASPTNVGKITINDAYTIGGNPIVLNGGIGRGGSSAVAPHIGANVTLGASQQFASNDSLPLAFDGTFNVNGQTLTTGRVTFNGAVTGSGTITSAGGTVTLAAPSNSFTGTFTNVVLTLNGSAPSAALHRGVSGVSTAPAMTVNGEQTIGDVTIAGDLRLNHPAGQANGIVHTGALAFDGPGATADGFAWARYFVDMNESSSDRVDAHGAVSINNALLDLTSPANTTTTQLPVGHVYTIVSNDGSDPVTGHFNVSLNNGTATLGEGTVFTVGAGRFRISYVGNDGNDITLTVIDPTKVESSVTTLTSNSPTVSGQLATFTVNVQPPSATGAVTLKIDGLSVGILQLDGGTASYITSGLGVGQHAVSAEYAGDGTYAASTSATITHTVAKANTTMAAAVTQSFVTVPAQTAVTAVVSTVAPGGGAPTGVVTLQENGVQVGSGFLVSGSALIFLNITTAGQHQYSVNYAGDAKFNGSSANVTITAGTVGISGADVTTNEGDFGTHNVDVTIGLTAARPTAVSITYHTEGVSATAGEDFVSTSGTLTIPAGSLQGVVSVTIISDVKPELDEKIALVLDSATDGTIATPRITITIHDDDVAYTRTHGIVYASPGGLALTLDVLTPVGAAAVRPAVIALGSDADQQTVIREAVRGYVVIIPVVRSTFPANIVDAKTVVRWAVANASQYGIDPNRVGVWGIAAGGNISALLGTSDGVAAVENSSEGYPGVSNRVTAFVDFYGETDYVALARTPAACTTDYTNLFGCSPDSCPELAATASPTPYVTRDDAAALIVHGNADCAVPIGQSSALNDALQHAGVPSTLLTVNGGHGGPPFVTDDVLTQVDAFLDHYLKGPQSTRRRAVHH
jgi:dienelactone hydrolase